MVVLERETARPLDRSGRAAGANRRDGPQARPGRADLRSAGARSRTCRRKLGYLRSRGHESSCSACSIRRRSSFTFAAPGMFHDLESGRELYVDPQRGASRLPAAVRRARRPSCSRRASNLGIDFAQLTTDRPLELALFDLLHARMRRGRRPLRRRGPPTEGRRMSLLTPLYVLGLLAVSLPIMFHLIRRTPQGRVSVQLADVPVAVAAAAHAPQPARPSAACCCCAALASGCWRLRLPGRSCGRRRRPTRPTATRGGVAMLVDTSASMRRGDLWQQAIADSRRGAGRAPAARSSGRVYVRRHAAAAGGL